MCCRDFPKQKQQQKNWAAREAIYSTGCVSQPGISDVKGVNILSKQQFLSSYPHASIPLTQFGHLQLDNEKPGEKERKRNGSLGAGRALPTDAARRAIHSHQTESTINKRRRKRIITSPSTYCGRVSWPPLEYVPWVVANESHFRFSSKSRKVTAQVMRYEKVLYNL